MLVGADEIMERRGAALGSYLRSKGREIEFSYIYVNKHDLWGIVDTLSAIVGKEDSCSFGLNGGEDLLLAAMGIVFERYRGRKRIEMHRCNIRSGDVSDCGGDGIALPVPCLDAMQLHICALANKIMREDHAI